MTIQLFHLTRTASVKAAAGRENYTRGLFVLPDGRKFYSLEDEDRHLETNLEAKVLGKTAIPRGRYRLKVTFSPHFNKMMTLVEGVPGYAGVRIHGGNKAEDSEGCILVGTTLTTDGIRDCAAAVHEIEQAVRDAAELGIESWLEVA